MFFLISISFIFEDCSLWCLRTRDTKRSEPKCRALLGGTRLAPPMESSSFCWHSISSQGASCFGGPFASTDAPTTCSQLPSDLSSSLYLHWPPWRSYLRASNAHPPPAVYSMWLMMSKMPQNFSPRLLSLPHPPPLHPPHLRMKATEAAWGWCPTELPRPALLHLGGERRCWQTGLLPKHLCSGRVAEAADRYPGAGWDSGWQDCVLVAIIFPCV